MQSLRLSDVSMTYNTNKTDQARNISIERVLMEPVARESAKFETSFNQLREGELPKHPTELLFGFIGGSCSDQSVVAH
jgi:hypothetical protein